MATGISLKLRSDTDCAAASHRGVSCDDGSTYAPTGATPAAAAAASYLTCCRSGPRARRQRTTRLSAEATIIAMTARIATQPAANTGRRASIPSGFATPDIPRPRASPGGR
jgi:hypothetical protein